MPELLDIYDDNLHHIGTKLRADVHRDGDWHKVFHCWVIYRDAQGDNWVIMERRGANKATFPGKLNVSAAGHYTAGETVRDGLRELEEELGLTPSLDELIPIGRHVAMAQYDGLIDREVADVFFYLCDQPLSDYRYQQAEIAGLVAVNTLRGLRLLSGEVAAIEVAATGFSAPTVTITRDDFIPVHDFYWEKIFLLATRCLNGETNLLI